MGCALAETHGFVCELKEAHESLWEKYNALTADRDRLASELAVEQARYRLAVAGEEDALRKMRELQAELAAEKKARAAFQMYGMMWEQSEGELAIARKWAARWKEWCAYWRATAKQETAELAARKALDSGKWREMEATIRDGETFYIIREDRWRQIEMEQAELASARRVLDLLPAGLLRRAAFRLRQLAMLMAVSQVGQRQDVERDAAALEAAAREREGL